MELLQQYQINPIHKARKSPEMSMADYLSRVGVDSGLVTAIQQDMAKLEADPPLNAIVEPRIVAREQELDPEIGPVLRVLQTGPAPEETARRLRLHLGTDNMLRYSNFRRRATQTSPLGVKGEQLVVLPCSL